MESKKKKKKGHEEPRGKTGIDTDLLENGLEDTGRGKGKLGQMREWHGHIYTTKRKIDS